MSYRKLLYHIVWRTHDSQPTIPESSKEHLLRMIWDYCENHREKRFWKVRRVNAHLDHVHLLVDIPPTIPLAQAVQEIKVFTSKSLHTHPAFKIFRGWNDGYGAFTVGWREEEVVRKYIANQSENHKYEDSRCELMRLLMEHDIPQDEFFDRNL